MKIHLLVIIVILLAGCVSREYNTATGKEDIMLLSTEKEVDIGRKIANSIANNPEIELDPDPLATERVIRIGNIIANVSDRKEVNYEFRVINKDEVNAFALPGGYIYIFSGLIEKTESDDELASVIAHEIAHVVARHSIKRLQGSYGYNILQLLMVATKTKVQDASNIDYALGQLIMSYSREDEALADKIAIKYLKKTGYEPRAIITFLEKLLGEHRKSPIRPYRGYSSHPLISDRIRMVKKELLGEIEFKDYMNKPVTE